MFRISRAPISAAAILVLGACGVTDIPLDPDPDPDPLEVDGVTVSASSTEVGIGGTLQLTATVSPFGVDPSVTWASNNEDRLMVDTNGLASAALLPLEAGAVTVTATSVEDPSFSGSIDLTITCGVLVSSDVSSGATLPEDTCYIAQSALSVSDGTLTVEPGVEVSFDPSGSLTIGPDGRLDAQGTMDKGIVFTSTDPLEKWRGIRFNGSRSGDNQLMYVTVENGGSDGWSGASYSSSAVYLSGASLVAVSSSTIRGSESQGLTALGEAEFTLTGTAFEENAIPMWLHPNNLEGVGTDNVFTANDDEVIRVGYGNTDRLSTAQAWPDAGIPYQLQDRMFVEAALEIGPGVEIEARSGVSLIVTSSGSLNAVGTEMNPVHIRGSEAERGWWKGIQIQSQSASNVFSWVVIEDGGSDQWTGFGDSRAMVYLDGNSTLSIGNSTFRNSDHYALWVPSGGDVSGLTDNTFEDNARIMIVHPNRVGGIDGSNAFSGNDEQAVRVTFGNNDRVEDAQTWQSLGVPYLVVDRTFVEAALTIEAGVTLEFAQGAHFIVTDEGSINAIGTALERITFRGREALAGYWKGIEVNTVSAANRFEFADFLHAGSSGWFGGSDSTGTLYVTQDGSVVINDVTVGLTEGYAAIVGNGGSLSCTAFDEGGFQIYVYEPGNNRAQATCPG